MLSGLTARWVRCFVCPACLFFLSWTWGFGANDTLRAEHISPDRGFSQSRISFVFQDRKGFIWFAGDEGLEKYDGYGFTSFRHDPFNPHSLSSGQIGQVVEDHDGRFWILAGKVLDRFDRKTESFTHYAPHADMQGALQAEPNLIFCDGSGTIWVGSYSGGLFRYNPLTDDFTVYRHDPDDPESLGGNRISAIFQSRSGSLWIATLGGGLNRYDPETGSFKRFLQGQGADFDFGYHIIPLNRLNGPIAEDKAGTLWIATSGGGLIGFNPETETLVQYLNDPNDRYSLSYNIIRSIFVDSQDLIWVVTSAGGVDLMFPETGTFRRFRAEEGHRGSLADDRLLPVMIAEDAGGDVWFGSQVSGLSVYRRNLGVFDHFSLKISSFGMSGDSRISYIFFDRAETLWMGTLSSGLHKFATYKQKYKPYLGHLFGPESLGNTFVDTLYQSSEGFLWIGTRDRGLMCFDPHSDRVVRHYRMQPGDLNSLSDDGIRAILDDQQGFLWVGTADGLNRLTISSGDFRNYHRQYGDPGSLNSNEIFCMAKDRLGRVWVGTGRGGLHLYDRERDRFWRLRFEPPGQLGFTTGAVTAITVADAQDLWVAQEGFGLHKLNTTSGEYVTYSHAINDSHSLSHNGITSLLSDRRGRLWVGTKGGGLNRFLPTSGSFQRFTSQSHGLPDNFIYGLLEDSRGQIWLSLGHGLSVLDPETETLKHYGQEDGLQATSASVNAFYKAPDGLFYYGGYWGFNRFDPTALNHNPHPPPIVVTAFEKLGLPIAGEMEEGDFIDLVHTDNYFTIEFAALDFTYPEKNPYAYKLEGFDRDWIYKEREHRADYTNIQGGFYTFRVKGANSDGVWNNDGFSIRIRIAPPFWRTGWFYFLQALLAVLAIFWGFLFQRSRLKRQQHEALVALDLTRKTEELEYARRIQISMLPEEHIDNEILDVYGQMRTATEVGGDYYDYFKLQGQRYCIMLGDATGHGFAAGLVVGMTKMGAETWAANRGTGLVELMAELNRGLKESITERSMGMGLGVAILDLRRLTAQLSCAGMPFPYHFRAETGRLMPLVMKSPPLGYFRKIAVQTKSVQLAGGDYLILFSDGFPERFNPQHKLWGIPALEAGLLAHCRDRGCAMEIGTRLFEACDRFAEGRPHMDDMSVVVIRIKGRAG